MESIIDKLIAQNQTELEGFLELINQYERAREQRVGALYALNELKKELAEHEKENQSPE